VDGTISVLLPESNYFARVRILQELAHLNEIEIPRNIIKSSPVPRAKSRMASLRAVTLPCLELCAALILSRLFNTVLSTAAWIRPYNHIHL
jgi:hypothetical protein